MASWLPPNDKRIKLIIKNAEYLLALAIPLQYYSDTTGVTRLVYSVLRSPWKIQIREKYGLNSKRCPFITLCVRTVSMEIPSVQ